MSRCSTARAISSAAPPRATMDTLFEKAWGWVISSPTLPRSAPNWKSRSWASANGRRCWSIRRMIRKTRIFGPKGCAKRYEQTIIFGTFADLARPLGAPWLAETMAKARTQGALRRHHRRRRRSWARCRLLSGQGTRPDQHCGSRKRLDRRRQYRAQYHHHPLELFVQRKRGALRSFGQIVGEPVAGAQLQRHVLAARRHDAGAYR